MIVKGRERGEVVEETLKKELGGWVFVIELDEARGGGGGGLSRETERQREGRRGFGFGVLSRAGLDSHKSGR